MSRRKGAGGEREVAALLRDHLGVDVCRRVRQHDGDSDLEGLADWAVEVKRRATAGRAEVAGWWAQATSQAARAGARTLPVLFYRVDRAPWRAVWPLSVHMAAQDVAMWRGYEWTVEGSIEAWCAVAREVAAACPRTVPPGCVLSPMAGGQRPSDVNLPADERDAHAGDSAKFSNV